jgi:hypothetical protein
MSRLWYFQRYWKTVPNLKKNLKHEKNVKFHYLWTIYHLNHLEKWFENRSNSSFSCHIGTFCIFKIKFKPCKICKKCEHEEVAIFQYLCSGISFTQFRQSWETRSIINCSKDTGSSSKFWRKVQPRYPPGSTRKLQVGAQNRVGKFNLICTSSASSCHREVHWCVFFIRRKSTMQISLF